MIKLLNATRLSGKCRCLVEDKPFAGINVYRDTYREQDGYKLCEYDPRSKTTNIRYDVKRVLIIFP